MLDLLIVPLLWQLVVPLGLLLWLALGRGGNRVAWGIEITCAGTYLAAVALAGVWTVLPGALPWAYVILFLAAIGRSAGRMRDRADWPMAWRGWLGLGVRGVPTAVVVALAVHVISGRRLPAGPVIDLAFPLTGGTYSVANGGSVALVNAHLTTLAEARFQAWRGQSYGIDLVRVNRWGARAPGILPRDPERYLIFGDDVLSPCIGRVVAAIDGLADLPPPQVDRRHMAGNHVIIECGEAWVVLGHLRQGSVCVRAGDPVRTGQPLGQVGNSGNSDEPHLHIHAQRPATGGAPMAAQPLVMRFANRYPVRNDRIDTTK